MFKNLQKFGVFCTLFLGVNLVSYAPALAHNEGPSMDDFGLDASLQILQNATELAPQFVTDDDGTDLPEIVPTMKIGGKKIYINSYMMELVKQNVRYMYSELERDMPGCQVAPLGQVMTEVDELGRQGFATKKILEPLGTAVSHITLSGADIGGRLGNIAFGAKIAAEIGEGVLSKVVGGGGVHVFCSVIDALIVFQTRGLQTVYRDFAMSKSLDTSVIRTMTYQGLVASSLNRAQQRVSFEFEPFEIDEHELEEVDEEGPRRSFLRTGRLWGPIREGKRAVWVKGIAQRAERNARKNKSFDENQLSNLAQIGSKEFLATRHKKFFWLLGRKYKSNYMAGKGLIDKALNNKRMLWILSVQENVLHRSLVKDPNGLEEAISTLDKVNSGLPDYGTDEVREGLAAEYGAGDQMKASEMNKLMMDIDRIFDPTVDKRLRYAQTLIIESTLTGFFYQILEAQITAMYRQDLNWVGRMAHAFRVHWIASKYAYYAHEFADYLRVVSLQDKPELLLSRKYESMEAMARVFKHLATIVPKAGVDPKTWIEQSQASNVQLKKFKPWIEKTSHYSFRNMVPFVPKVWRENFADYSFIPEADKLWKILRILPSRAPLCVEMDARRRVL